MVTKTRDRLIEVARHLFSHKGVENTTMNDIATASDKGRRTIYTYFKNKRDIYNAVVEREGDQLMEGLNGIASSELAPAEKMRSLLGARFDIFHGFSSKRDMLRSFFGRDFKRMERIHRIIFSKERALYERVLAEIVEAGLTTPRLAEGFPMLAIMTFEGVDYSHFRNNFTDIGYAPEAIKAATIEMLMASLGITE